MRNEFRDALRARVEQVKSQNGTTQVTLDERIMRNRGNTKMNKALSRSAEDALRKIRALRSLPETTGTWTAERKVLNELNSIDTLAVAMELAAEAEASNG
jgi:hypothetical protein